MKEFECIEDRIEWQQRMQDLMLMITNDTASVAWYRNAISRDFYNDREGIIRHVEMIEKHIVFLKKKCEEEWNELNWKQQRYYAHYPYNFVPWWLDE